MVTVLRGLGDYWEGVSSVDQVRRMVDYESNFIDGAWSPSVGTEHLPLVNPFTEELLGHVADATPQEVDGAVRAAERALPPWSARSLDERIEVVLRIKEGLDKRRDKLASLATAHIGMPYRTARGLGDALNVIDMLVESVRAVTFEYLRRDVFGTALVTRRPVGVVGAIVPWNAPVRSELKKIVPALLAGCTIVVKSAPETPYAGSLLAEICAEAGVPPGVLNVVVGGRGAGAALVRHPAVRKIAFTGSSATGSWIAAEAAQGVKRVQLELGGKSAAIVLDDVDLDAVVPQLAASSWVNSGQACVALTRFLVPRDRQDELVGRLVAEAGKHVLGDPFDDHTTMGPLFARRHFEAVSRYVSKGVDEGATLVTGGRRPEHLEQGFHFEPTVFRDVTPEMTIAREEIFGPVTSVLPYDTVDEAVSIANGTVYGLHGAVLSADEDRALSIARRIDSGSVGVNQVWTPTSAPFGGVKSSGIGREHGPEGYEGFLEYVTFTVSPEHAEKLAQQYPKA